MDQTVTITNHETQPQENQFRSASITNFSNVCIELICVDLNRQLTLHLDYTNCLEDITQFLTEHKLVHKDVEINYLLPNNPLPLNTLWTLKQIMDMYDLQYQDKLYFTVQIKEEEQQEEYVRKLRKSKQAGCKLVWTQRCIRGNSIEGSVAKQVDKLNNEELTL